jgi:hypothetical protein
LIALSINNRNENRKENIEEGVVLKNLFENLILAKKQSKALILEEDNLKKSLIFILGIGFNQIKEEPISVSGSIFESAVRDLQTN